MQEIFTRSGVSRQYSAQEIVFMLGEELKKPLTTIKALAESDMIVGSVSAFSNPSEGQKNIASKLITLEAKKALRTIDNVLLHQQLSDQQVQLPLGPVHIGSTLTTVANDLQPLSLSRGCETEVFIQSGLSSIHSNPAVLSSGLECLWQAVLQMTLKPSVMTWHIYKPHTASEGVRISLTNSSIDLSAVTIGSYLKSTSAGHSRQPVAGASGPSTDLVTAINFFELAGGFLRKTKKDGKAGFAVTLPASTQLTLI